MSLIEESSVRSAGRTTGRAVSRTAGTIAQRTASRRAKRIDTSALPPGPRLPVLLQTYLFMVARSWTAPRWQGRYGDIYAMNIVPAGPSVVLSNPDDIRAVFAGPADTFHAGEGNLILGPIMGEHSVLLLDEKEHLAARKRVMSAFHGEAVSNWGALIGELAAQTVAQWPVGTPFSVHPFMNDISLEVILRIVFGVTDEADLDELRPLLKQVVKVGPVVFAGWLYPQLENVGPWKKFAALKAKTDRAIYAEITRRRAVTDLGGRTDVLSKLLVADPEMSDAELRDHLVTLLLAGHETTASTLAWTFHDLARRPEQLARAQRAADADDDAYLEAVVKESMRLRPVIANIARRLAKPARVGGYDLPAGVVVFPSIALVQRRAAAFPEPDVFRPERFLDGAPPPATWIPFGGGIRRCLGAALAMTEAKAVLHAVLQRVDIAPVGREEGTRMRNVTAIPARGARIIVRPR